jgi:hypothetical protein
MAGYILIVELGHRPTYIATVAECTLASQKGSIPIEHFAFRYFNGHCCRPDTGSPAPGSESTLKTVLKNDTEYSMKKRHRATLELIFARPVNGSIRWADIETLLVALGAEVSEREGSRVGVFLFGEVRVFHRPHPSPDTDKGAVSNIRKWLDEHGVRP